MDNLNTLGLNWGIDFFRVYGGCGLGTSCEHRAWSPRRSGSVSWRRPVVRHQFDGTAMDDCRNPDLCDAVSSIRLIGTVANSTQFSLDITDDLYSFSNQTGNATCTWKPSEPTALDVDPGLAWMPTTLTDVPILIGFQRSRRPAAVANGSAFQKTDDNPVDGFFEQTAYKGVCFDLWLWSWSWLAENGKLTPEPTAPLYRGEIKCGMHIGVSPFARHFQRGVGMARGRTKCATVSAAPVLAGRPARPTSAATASRITCGCSSPRRAGTCGSPRAARSSTRI